MYNNKNRNKGVKLKLGLICAFFAVILGCLIAFASSSFGVQNIAQNGGANAASTDVNAGDEDENSSKLNDISAPKPEIKATATTVNSGTTASAMASAWANAISQSSSTNKVTFVLQADWSAQSNSSYTTAFGTDSTAFAEGALFVPMDANIVLDLNGYTLDRCRPNEMYGNVIQVEGTLEICDNSASPLGKITGAYGGTGGAVYLRRSTANVTLTSGTITDNETIGSAGGVYVGGGSFTMNGGSIISNESFMGGGVYMSGGTFTMNGGSISNNTVEIPTSGKISTEGGGGVYLNGGTFTMNGGNISKNTTNADGAGVYIYNSGTVNLNGGAISNNKTSGQEFANSDSGYGAGIRMQSGTVNLNGGDIINNVATSVNDVYGGGIYMSGGNINLTSGNISGNRAEYNGAAVYMCGSSTFNMTGGNIEKNISDGDSIICMVSSNNSFKMTGGNIADNSSEYEVIGNYGGTLTITGGNINNNISYNDIIINQSSGKLVLSGGTIFGNTGVGVYYLGGTFELSGNPSIYANTGSYGYGVYISTGKTITVTGSLVGTTIYVTMKAGTGVFTSGYNTYNSSYAPNAFFRALSKVVSKSGNEVAIETGTSSMSYMYWRYGSNITEVNNYTPSSGFSATLTYTGNALQVGAYTTNNTSASALTISSRVYKDVNGNSISTSSAILNAGTYAFMVNNSAYQNQNFKLTILPAEIDSAIVTVGSSTYTGSAVTPAITVSLGGNLVASTNYTCTYVNNVNAGTATVTIIGKNNLQGSITKTFTINPKAIDGATVNLGTSAYTYNGSAKTPSVTSVVSSSRTVSTDDYTITYSNNVNAGTAYVIITGKNNYTGSVTKAFTISPVTVTSGMITLGTTTYTYDGSAKQPTVTVQNGSTTVPTGSYSLSYSNNVNASTSATVTLTFSGNYSGTVSKTFTINPASLASAGITFGLSSYPYSGSAITPVPTVKLSDKTLAQNIDFTVAYADNVNAGSGKITITGTGNYTGEASGAFTIDKREIFVSGISVANKEYDGTTKAEVDTSKAKLTGVVDADIANLGLEFTAGSEFDSAAVGLRSVTITGIKLTGDAAGNYILDFDAVTRYAQIYPANITISGIEANSRQYDGTTKATFDASSASITGAVAEEIADLIANLTVNGSFASKNAGEGVTVNITGYILGGDYAGNYVVDLENSDKSVTTDMTQAEVTVTLGKAEYKITYGNALKITYSQDCDVKSESVTLALEYYDENGNTKLAGVPTDAGKYLVKVVVDPADENVANYTVITTGEGVLSQAKVIIEKATLTVTAEDKTIEYGSAKPADGDYVLIYNGWLNGDKAEFEAGNISFINPITISTDYDPDDEDNKNADTYYITLSDGELKNYELTFVDGVLTVKAKKVTVTIDDKSSVYGAKEVELTSDGTDDMQITLERAEGDTVGKYAITGTWENTNYEVTFVDGVYEITKAKLTVTANPNAITYGDKAANNGVEYDGFIAGENESVLGGTLAYRYTYTQYGDIYELDADGETPVAIKYYVIPYGLTADNYEIEFVNGLLTIEQKKATVTVSNAASDITNVPADREEAAEKIKYTVDGTVNGDDLIVKLIIAENGTRKDGNATYGVTWCAVGSYDVTGTFDNSNYVVTFVYEDGATHGTYTVAQGTLTITANTLIISYGEEITFSADWDEAVTAEGLPVGSTLKDLLASGVISGNLAVLAYGNSAYDEYAAMGSAYRLGDDIFDGNGNRISYIVIPTGLSSSSYNIAFKPGKLMVEPKSIIVNIDDKTSVYGEKDKELTASVADGVLVNYDPEESTVVEFLAITGLKREEGTDAGSYAITADGSGNKNYRVTFVNGVYTVSQYEVTVVWVSGTEDGKFEYTYNGENQAPVATFEMPNPADPDNPLTFKSTDEEASRVIEVNGNGLNAGEYKAQAFLLNNNLKFSAATKTTQTFKVNAKQLTVSWFKSDDDKGDATKVIDAKETKNTPVEYSYRSGYPYAPVVVLDGIIDKDNGANFYYISGEQNAVSITPYEAVLHILNANYYVADDDASVWFKIVMSAPDGFKWYESTAAGSQEISSLTEYVFNNEIQHPVAKALGDAKFIYTYYKLVDGTETEVYETLHVGNYKIVATPVDNNLKLTDEDATFYFNIVAKEVTVVWSATSFEYNGLKQVPTAYYEAFGQNITLDVTLLNGNGIDANAKDETYGISVTLTSDDFTFVVDGENVKTLESSYTITAKNITITWTSKYTDEDGKFKWEMVYENSDESESVTPEATMINAVPGDDLNGKLSLSVWYQADEKSEPVQVDKIHDAGIYTLRVSLASKDGNYKLVDDEQTFTITRKSLTITANGQEVQTGKQVPALTAKFDGFADGEDETDLNLLNGNGGMKYLSTNYNLNSPYIGIDEYTKDEDIEKLETIADIKSGNLTGYFIAFTDSEASLAELKAILSNYDVTFVYGRLTIIAVEGTVSIVLTQSYNGEDQTPAAKYKVGDTWIDLKVDVYEDEARTTKAESVKDVGAYYLVISKYAEDSVLLEGAEADGSVKKVFNIIAREIEVKITDKSVVYGELTEENYEEYLAKMWEYASRDALRRPLEEDEEGLNIALNAEITFVGGYAVVGNYTVTGEWSDDETLRKNYTVKFIGNDGEEGTLKITEATITYTANITDGFNQILETSNANGNYRLGLYSKKDGKYQHIGLTGNQNANVTIYYSAPYDLSIYDPSTKLPEDEDGDVANGIPASWENPALLCDVPHTADGTYLINFKIVVDNHEPYYGQWTVKVIAGRAYIKILFTDDKYELAYGDELLTGTALATMLLNEGKVTCNDLADGMFRENILNGNLTARVLVNSASPEVGSYDIVFEGIEKLNPDWIITYKQDVNAGDETATNIGKCVIVQRKLTINWDKTSFVYDGEAHLPVPGIEGWTRAEGSEVVNGATVYTFTNEQLGKTLKLSVRTNGGDFTNIGGENFVIAEISDGNYSLDSFNATRAVSITGDIGSGEPVLQEGGLPGWALGIIIALAVLTVFMIIVLAASKRKTQPAADADGFYDDVDAND